MTDPALEAVAFQPMGKTGTPFADIDGMPVQATAAIGIVGRIELDPALTAGLVDLDGFGPVTTPTDEHLTRAESEPELGGSRSTRARSGVERK